jgi:outer membrane protein OmpA-like peptidoglycan-associated protein
MTMAIDLVDLVKGYLTPDVVQKAAAFVGESSGATEKALAGIVPALIGALTNAASTSDGAQQLVRTLDAGKYDGRALSSVTGLFGGGSATQDLLSAGKGIVDSLLGAKTAGVSDLIARFAGIRTGSASSLLALAAPLVMHVLGRQRASIGIGASSVASLLGDQRSLLTGTMPAGLGALLGWSGSAPSVAELGSTAASAASRAVREATPARPGWVVPLIVIGALILGALIWLGWPQTAARRVSELQLPNGVRISVPSGSLNLSLAHWLAGSTDVGVPKRFVFDDLTFETGSTDLTLESVGTVNTLVAVLTAYPAVAVALEGYTDSTGDPTANQTLSLARAVAVKRLMVKGGIDESRISSAGYGQDNPVASNDSEQGRAMNRRLELVVVKR